MFYWILVFIWSIVTLYYFDTLRKNNTTLVATKGSLKEKTYFTIKMISIFTLPYIMSFGNIEFFFDTFTVTVFIGMFCELILVRNKNEKFNTILILLTLFSLIFAKFFVVGEIDYKKIFIGVLIVSCMDTFMNIIGKHIVSNLPKYIPVFRYPKSISGNKTVLSVLLSLLLNIYVFSFLFEITIFSINDILCISLLTAIGDGVYSYYKRIEEIDDFSNILGKVGGFCDRFDSWILSLIFIYLS